MKKTNLKNKNIKKVSRLTEAFRKNKKSGKKTLVPFITAGDPSVSATKKLILAIEEAGADIIELGIPFSDPMADGPTIQASSERALKRGVTVDTVFSIIKDVRKKTDIPIVLFGYYNPVFAYGLGKFARNAKRVGADGVLIVDLPPEEDEMFHVELRKVGMDLIHLLTPTSDTTRMKLVARRSDGFIYYVSVAGVTGARKSVEHSVGDYIKKIRRHTKLPVVVGFGISTPSQARSVGRLADGVVVGSAIINVIEKKGSSKTLVRDVKKFVSALNKGLE